MKIKACLGRPTMQILHTYSVQKCTLIPWFETLEQLQVYVNNLLFINKPFVWLGPPSIHFGILGGGSGGGCLLPLHTILALKKQKFSKEKGPHVIDSSPKHIWDKRKGKHMWKRWGVSDAKGGYGEGNLGEVSSMAWGYRWWIIWAYYEPSLKASTHGHGGAYKQGYINLWLQRYTGLGYPGILIHMHGCNDTWWI